MYSQLRDSTVKAFGRLSSAFFVEVSAMTRKRSGVYLCFIFEARARANHSCKLQRISNARPKRNLHIRYREEKVSCSSYMF